MKEERFSVFIHHVRNRKKFVPYPVIQHQQQFVAIALILNSKEAFGSVVIVGINHFWGGDHVLKLCPVWLKINTTVKKYFQVGPHFA